MNTVKTVGALLFLIAITCMAQPARADSADAMCEFYKHGDEKPNRSGPCTFSQRQGYIDIDLRNGDTFSLAPGKNPDHFKDQKDNKVVRTVHRNSHEYVWENKKIIVKFESDRDGGHHRHQRHATVSLDDLVGARASSADSELSSRGFRTTGGYKREDASFVTWYNSDTRQCVEVMTKEGRIRKIDSINEGNCL